MIHKNFSKVLNCINSCKTRHHCDASERMIAFYAVANNLKQEDGSVTVLNKMLHEKRVELYD